MYKSQFASPSLQAVTPQFKEKMYRQPAQEYINPSPYVMDKLVDDQQLFVGRTDAMGEVFRLLSSPVDHILGFYGQPLIGKSSLLQELASCLPKMAPYRPIYVELQDKNNLHVLEVCESLTSELAKEFNLFLPLSKMIHKRAMTVDIFYEQFLPCALESLDDHESLVLLFDTPFSYGKQLLQTPPMQNSASQMTQPDRQPLIGIPFLRFLSDLISQPSQHVKIVFTIKEHYLNGQTFSHAQNIRWHHLSFLRPQETNQLITLLKQKTGLTWSSEAMTCLQEFTAGHPFLAQQLSQVVCQRAYRKQQNTLSSAPMIQAFDVEAALLETVAKISHQLSLWWQGLSFTEQVVLATLAEGAMSQEALTARLLKEDITIEEQLPQTIKALLATDLIRKTNDALASDYGLTVDLLRRWIAEHKPLKYVSLEGQTPGLTTYKFAPTAPHGFNGTVNQTSPQTLPSQPLSQADAILTGQLKKQSLSVWNPLDHLRLLWWVLVEPQDFSLYKAQAGTEELYQIGKWSASTLIWLPLFIPSLALATETLPRVLPPSLNDVSLTTSLFMAWLLTGSFGDREDDAPVMVGTIASGIIAVTVMLGFTGGLMSALAGCLALGIAFGMSTRLALAIAFAVTDRLGSGVALGMLGGIIFGAITNVILGMGQQMAIGITIGVGLIVIFILAGSMLLRLNQEANQKHTSLLGMIGFALLLLSHLFLLWYSFLGGWQLFA